MAEGILRGIFGVALLLGICVLLSNQRKAINWRLVIGGVGLQIILAVLILATPFGNLV